MKAVKAVLLAMFLVAVGGCFSDYDRTNVKVMTQSHNVTHVKAAVASQPQGNLYKGKGKSGK